MDWHNSLIFYLFFLFHLFFTNRKQTQTRHKQTMPVWKLMEHTQIHMRQCHLRNIHRYSAIITQTIPQISSTRIHQVTFTSREATTTRRTSTINDLALVPDFNSEAGNVAAFTERQRIIKTRSKRRTAWVMPKWIQRKSLESSTRVSITTSLLDCASEMFLKAGELKFFEFWTKFFFCSN